MNERKNMARQKEYKEEEVVEKAMNLFWRNGFETTSMQMLEKEMNINKFSIYSSFGSKNGLFKECLKCYRKKLNKLMNKLKNSSTGLPGIKQYFYDFVAFSKETEFGKGCLVTNTSNQIGENTDLRIKKALSQFTNEVRQLYLDTLKQDKNKEEIVCEQQADYLIIAMYGLSSASKNFTSKQLENYIENIFKGL